MGRINTFKIQFHSFGNGAHELLFEVNDSFFAFFEESDISKGQMKISVQMIKSERQMQFDFHLLGDVEVVCDRCLDTFNQAIDSKFTLYGKIGIGNSEDELEVVWIHPGDHEVDLADYVYEYIVLSLPIKKIHPEDEEGVTGCDPDMLDKLSEILLITED